MRGVVRIELWKTYGFILLRHSTRGWGDGSAGKNVVLSTHRKRQAWLGMTVILALVEVDKRISGVPWLTILAKK